MSVQEGWANNKGVRIHYIDVDPHPPSEEFVPVLIVPGALHPAENYLLAASLLTPRRVVVPSLRGRGKSDAPQTGYSFQEHLTDIEAVVEKSELDTFCLMAYSLGVPYAIGYAIRHPQRVTGFIVGDFPAYYPALPPKWWEQRAVADSQDQVESHVIRALQRESSEVLLWDDLDKMECPALILRGGRADSLLTAEESEMYRRRLRQAKVVVFEESGHVLWEPDYERFMRTVQTFLDWVDQRLSGV